ncbi:MAG TPA: exosortase/archaeosortase family protein [Candidatus Binatus sp.]|jgi:exosortase|nr:exosortase/archaeosortase family protein [Candidatus Binatus sp.]
MVTTDPNREAPFKSSPLLIFASLSVVAVVIWWIPLVSLFDLALRDEQYTHILLILPISAALVALDWKSLPRPSGSGGAAAGSALLVGALLARVGARWTVSSADVQLSLNVLALVAWWMGAFILCFGTRAFRRALFPLCFLLWMVPLPQFVLDPIVSLLQRGSAASAHLLFALAGIPVAQSDMQLHIPGLTLEVAPECSSIRSSMILLVITMVVAQLLLRSFWRKAVVVAVALPLSVAKNGLRIFVIGALTTKVDPSFMTGRLHRQGGVIFLLIALLGTFLVLWILRRGENRMLRISGPYR